MKRGLGAIAVAMAIAGCTTVQQDRAATASPCAASAVHSVQQVITAQGELAYDVCAGTLAVADADGQPAADLFYTAYFRRDSGPTRPLSFVWNGGPGADSRLLHFHALGPKVFRDGALADNPQALLIASDLVFLDPAGTGFSRPHSDEAAAHLYGTVGDIAATADFIRGFRAAYGRGQSPLFLFGESFGTWRAAGTAEALADAGVSVDGIGLISGGIPLGEERDRARSRALSLPNRTATALVLNRLDPALQAKRDEAVAEAGQWARSVWYPALNDPASLSPDQRAQVIAGIAAYHGMQPSQIDPETLWVSPRDFRTGLLPGKTLDVFDMRQMAAAPEDGQEAAIVAYYRDVLGYAQGRYAGIETDAIPVGAQWQYDQAPVTKESLARAMAGEGPPSPSQPWTLNAMRKMPGLQVFVAAGLYDSLNSCVANEATVADLPGAIAQRIALHCYPGGHMMYDRPEVAAQFGKDLIAFVSNSLSR